MVNWTEFINSLGKTEDSPEVNQLFLSIKEIAEVSSDPIEYNDPIDRTTYYSFVRSGIEVGFRRNVLNHIHFYFNHEETYDVYNGMLISNICFGSTKESILNILGKPSAEGGGYIDMLLGYINSWIKYNFQHYDLNFQFSEDDTLNRCSLIFIP